MGHFLIWILHVRRRIEAEYERRIRRASHIEDYKRLSATVSTPLQARMAALRSESDNDDDAVEIVNVRPGTQLSAGAGMQEESGI